MMKSTLIKDLYGEIERLKAEVYAVMEKNGVYIPRERYFQEESERKAMADQNEKIGMTIENHQKELQAKYDYQVHQSFYLGKQLDATQNNLNLTSKYHASLLENDVIPEIFRSG
ncbi:Kinesin-like protein KIN-5C [Orobanche minor]